MNSSCNKDENFGEVNTDTVSHYRQEKGIYVVNEGVFGNGNGSVSFYSTDSGDISADVFYSANGIPLGDVPVSITIHDSLAYVVVNNSARIEVVRMRDFKRMATITGFVSPRRMLIVGNDKAYVSDLKTPSLYIVNLATNAITGNVTLGKAGENLMQVGNEVFVTNWSNYFVTQPNKTVQIVNVNSDLIIDSIAVVKEPNSLVLDKNGKMWVLSSGGYMHEEMAALQRIDPANHTVEQTYTFTQTNDYPTALSINTAKDELMFVNKGVFRMGIADALLPASPLIVEGIHTFTNAVTDSGGQYIYVTDAKDYLQNGTLIIYTIAGVEMKSVNVGISPGFMVFGE
ncbi:MAG: DUF5074 domain-containing protein [Bacteroidota bacterium]